jgi:adenosylhomocysteinase
LWAENEVSILKQIKEKFLREKTLKGNKISSCLHINAETANLAVALKTDGAGVCFFVHQTLYQFGMTLPIWL